VLQQHFAIRQAPMPFAFPVMRQMVQYHQARTSDDGLRWLVDEIRRAAAEAANHPPQ
jgi:LysR family transcriptional regulator, nod-box dependent transcriptional activator